MIVPKARQLPSGMWFINLRLGGRNIPITETTEKRCRHEAERIKARWLSEKKLDVLTRERCSLGRAIDDYIASKTNVLSPSTIRGYKQIRANRFQRYIEEDISLINWQHAVNQEAASCSAKTLHNAFMLVSSAVFAKTGTRPQATLPQIVRKERPYLTPEQIPVFMEALRGTPVEIPALLGLCSLRQSEILGLQWKDINLKRGVARVSGAVVLDENNMPVYKATNKNSASARTVPLMPQLVEALKREEQSPDTFVVQRSGGSIHDRVNTICRRAGLPEIGVHGLRHSFASLAYYLQIPYKVAMQIGGWSDDTTMQKIYTHISESDIAVNAAEILNFYKNVNENVNSK